MTSHEDTFLNINNFNNLVHKVNKSCKLARENNVPSRKLEIMRSKFKYINTFETKGVQGIAGILEHRETGKQIVFKLSIEIDRTIEHENQVTLALNSLRSFCPNFVGNLGCIELPISRSYIYINTPEDTDDEYSSRSDDRSDKSDRNDKSDRSDRSDSRSEESDGGEEEDRDEYKLFMDDKEYLPTNMLLLEYVSPYSFDDFCKYADKALLNSLILGVLCALGISQKHLNFTHYDLHIDNILIRECEPEAIFIYKIDGNSFVVPTFGFFPVIIDMGLSYCKELEGSTTKTPVEHYNKGLQSTVFDKFNDIHHFLISALYSVEYEEEEFYYLSTKMLYFFRHIPILRKRGWKMLPNNILKLTMREIVKSCLGLSTGYKPKEKPKSKMEELRQKKIEKRNKEMNVKEEETHKKKLGLNELPIWIDLDREILSILSLGIPLPWKKELEDEIKERFENIELAIQWSFITLIKELQKLYDLEHIFEDTNDLFFMIRELSTLVFENWNIIKKDTSKDTSKKLFNDYKRKIIPDFRDCVYKLDWNNTLLSCKYCLNILSVLYSKYLEVNNNIIKEYYEKTEINNIIDMIKFYIKNTAIRPVYNDKTILYIWDADKKSNKRVSLIDLMSKEEISLLDNLSPSESSKKLNNKIFGV
jgi:hypothetical protein